MPNGRAVWSGEITSGVRRYVQLLQQEACRRHPQFPDCCNPRIEDWQHGPLGMLRYIWEDEVDIIWKGRSTTVSLSDSGIQIGVLGESLRKSLDSTKRTASANLSFTCINATRPTIQGAGGLSLRYFMNWRIIFWIRCRLMFLSCPRNWKRAKIGTPSKSAYVTPSPRVALFPMNC